MNLNIVIVGAGSGGTSILKSLTSINDIHIDRIIDMNLNAPGIKIAKELGINFSQSIEDIDIKPIDMIIEATGIDKVSKALYDRYGEDCKIIDSQGALLIMTLVERDIQTLGKLNDQITTINNTTTVVQNHLETIKTSINNIHEVSKNLHNTSEVSNKHIEDSDKIIRYVNKIAQQIKILGLNATIEAARAGEYGQGFSVVAKEIQRLANDSESFAKEINDILAKLSSEIKSVTTEVHRLNHLSEVQIDASQKVSGAVESLKEQTKKSE